LQDLRLLIQSRYPILYVETYDEERLAERLARIARELGLPFSTWSATRGLERLDTRPAATAHPHPPLANEIPPSGNEPGDSRQPLEVLRRIHAQTSAQRLPALYLLRDFHPYLADPAVVRALRELAQESPSGLVTVVLCSPALDLPIELRRVAARYALQLPGEDELAQTVIETFRDLKRSHAVRYGLREPELHRLAQSLRGLTLPEVRRLVTLCTLRDGALDAADLPAIAAAKQEDIEKSGLLEFCPADGEIAPLGGLIHLKAWLDRFAAGFTDRARDLGLPAPRGVLLTGVQGCGKSLAAKTIARQWGLPLARFDPGRLFDKYIGESEKNLRSALATAEALAPIVLWIDEIEKAFAGGAAEADAGLSRRLLGGFLTWMQEHPGAVFIAATANDVGAVPPELLRKGRFDEVFFVDLPGAPERREIFAIHLRLRKQDPAAFDLDRLAAAAAGWSGAEVEQAVVAALYGMLAEGGSELTTERLLREIAGTVPLSRSREEQVAELREMARQRFVSAG
jgi:hypothetical protein